MRSRTIVGVAALMGVMLWGVPVRGSAGDVAATSVAPQAQTQKALPEQLARAAKRWKVDPKDVVVTLVRLDDVRTDDKGRLLEVPLAYDWNADRTVAPASTAKLVTTLAALETLGPAHHWFTGFYADAEPDAKGVLQGNLYVRGGGDPTLVIEDFALQVDRLAQWGVKHLKGDIVVDRSHFDIPKADPGAFDGRKSRPYNLPADAALINYRNLSLELLPEENGRWARIVTLPHMAGVSVPKRVKLSKGPCGDWKTKLGFRLQKNKDGTRRVRLNGSLPAACGPKSFNVIAFGADEYFERTFRYLWEQKGRTWKGRVVEGPVAPAAERRFVRLSPSLGEAAALTNKWSNNVMARHIFLSLGEVRVREEREAREEEEAKTRPAPKAKSEGKQGAPEGHRFDRGITIGDARSVLADWLDARGIGRDALWIDNGSGLSRKTRVTGRAMAKVLAAGWHGPYMPEFASSLPITGEDGTMRKRAMAPQDGRIKTGFLADVRSIGGYIRAEDGTRYAVYASVHGKKNMPGGIVFLDNVIDWVYKRPGSAGG